MKHTIAVDLDGVILRYDRFAGQGKLDDPLPGAKDFMQKLCAMGTVIVHTSRINRMQGDPIEWKDKVMDHLELHGIQYHQIWWGQGKPIASAYVDDSAVVCQPQKAPDNAYTSAIVQIMCRFKEAERRQDARP